MLVKGGTQPKGAGVRGEVNRELHRGLHIELGAPDVVQLQLGRCEVVQELGSQAIVSLLVDLPLEDEGLVEAAAALLQISNVRLQSLPAGGDVVLPLTPDVKDDSPEEIKVLGVGPEIS